MPGFGFSVNGKPFPGTEKIMAHSGYFLVLAFFWGSLLGIFYFGGLWLTVRMLPGSLRPKLLWFSSFTIRQALTLYGLWIILKENMSAFFITLTAFFIIRFIMVKKIGRA